MSTITLNITLSYCIWQTSTTSVAAHVWRWRGLAIEMHDWMQKTVPGDIELTSTLHQTSTTSSAGDSYQLCICGTDIVHHQFCIRLDRKGNMFEQDTVNCTHN